MKLKKSTAILMAVISVLTVIFCCPFTASAVDQTKNPWRYSATPTRAIYYKKPVMTGNDVKWVQQALNTTVGAGIKVDGSFGPASKAATLVFQKKYKMTADGSFGPDTRKKMVSVLNNMGYYPSQTTKAKSPWDYSATPTRAIYYKKPVMTGNDVKWVQQALNITVNAKLDVDGSFGPASKAATIVFQKKYGLSADGSFGSETRKKMVSVLNSLGYNSPNQTPSKPTGNNTKYNLCWPTKTSAGISGKYGTDRGDHIHAGIDIGVPKNTNIYAVSDGEVIAVHDSSGARGRYVVVYHKDLDISSLYQHCQSIKVKKGDTVKKGQVIALSGASGYGVDKYKKYDWHLHFELKNGNQTTSNKKNFDPTPGKNVKYYNK